MEPGPKWLAIGVGAVLLSLAVSGIRWGLARESGPGALLEHSGAAGDLGDPQALPIAPAPALADDDEPESRGPVALAAAGSQVTEDAEIPFRIAVSSALRIPLQGLEIKAPGGDAWTAIDVTGQVAVEVAVVASTEIRAEGHVPTRLRHGELECVLAPDSSLMLAIPGGASRGQAVDR